MGILSVNHQNLLCDISHYSAKYLFPPINISNFSLSFDKCLVAATPSKCAFHIVSIHRGALLLPPCKCTVWPVGGRIIDNRQIDNLQIDKLQIDNRQIDNQNLQIDNQHITFFRAFSDMNRTMADLLYSIMFSRASYSGILF